MRHERQTRSGGRGKGRRQARCEWVDGAARARDGLELECSPSFGHIELGVLWTAMWGCLVDSGMFLGWR